MRRPVIRVPARAALVVVGVTLCLFGAARATTAHDVGGAPDAALASAGLAASTVEHAIVERPTASTVVDLSDLIGPDTISIVVAALTVWLVVVVDLDRAVLAMVGVPWRRRGPPEHRA